MALIVESEKTYSTRNEAADALNKIHNALKGSPAYINTEICFNIGGE